MPPRVAAVIFDYGGVLRREEFGELAADLGVTTRWLWDAFHAIPQYAWSRTGRTDAAAYREAVVARIATVVPRPRVEAALAAWDALRARGGPVDPPMEALVRRLRGQVRLGVLSNAGRGAREHLEALGVAALFDDVVCSGDVGLAKPDPAIFALAARRLDVEPSACAFLDDQQQHVDGARSIGMHAHRHDARRTAETEAFLRGLDLDV